MENNVRQLIRLPLIGMNGKEDALRAGDTHIQDGVKSEYFEATLKENKKLSKVMEEEDFIDFLDYGVLQIHAQE